MAVKIKEGLEDQEEISDINVTPFIDVMLVLLIIFMVAAPLATVDVKVDLPASTAQPSQRPDKPLFLSVKADNSLFLGNEPVDMAGLGAALDQQTGQKYDTPIFFQANKNVTYEKLIDIMNTLREAGYLKVGLVGLEATKAQ